MFVINTFVQFPTILSLDMSGNSLKIMVASNMVKPVGLAIDIVLQGRVFWADRGLQTIESCYPDGTDRTVHIKDSKCIYTLGL